MCKGYYFALSALPLLGHYAFLYKNKNKKTLTLVSFKCSYQKIYSNILILLSEVLRCCLTVDVTEIPSDLLYCEWDQNQAFKNTVLSPSQ